MTQPTYSIPLQVAAFTFSANSAADLSFASLAAMQDYVTKISRVNLADTVMQGLIGSDWTTVWGPVVWINPNQQGTDLVADNTMSCYYSPSQKVFVIAIAGTNPSSMFDWKNEDFAISSMVAWNTVSPGSGNQSGYISTGSFNGMNVLLEMSDAGSVTMLSALQSYIRTNNITGATIAVGGHSLGGALAPCLGLYLYDNLDTLHLTGQNIAVYAYAGPTPGNQNFATYYNGRINTTTFTYSSQYNTIDVIPMGSVLADLATIPAFYSANLNYADTPVNTFLGVLTTGLQLASFAGSFSGDGSPYTQVSKGLTAFPTTATPFNSDVYTNCSNVIATDLTYLEPTISATYMSELGNFINFAYQAAAQHGPAYCGGTISLPLPEITNIHNIWTSQPVTGALGIDAFTTEYQLNLANNKPATATFNSGVTRAIKLFTGIDFTKLPPADRSKALNPAEETAALNAN